MKNIYFRQAAEKDRALLLGFEQNLIAHERAFDLNLKAADALYYNMDYLLHDPRVHFIVAIDNSANNDTPVACGYVKLLPNATNKYADPYYGYVGFMYTEPTYCGKGIAQQVLKHLIAWSEQQEVTQIVLEVYEKNQSAVRAYEKAGFETLMSTMLYRK
jgi:ribosomal protein S18 acetylase RimI-like enzyme